jgi:pyruvate dehydrogenase E1 component
VRKILGPVPEDRFWYLTLYNENYVMPALPHREADSPHAGASEDETEEDVRRGILRGIYRFAPAAHDARPSQRSTRRKGQKEDQPRRATLLFSGPLWQIAMEARDMLAADWAVSCDAWSVTSYSELRVDALSVERWNRLHPDEAARVPFVTQALTPDHEDSSPVVAVTDYIRAVPDQVSRWVGRPFVSLGTDGFGRSDTRAALRRFFEVDAAHVVVAVLASLAREGEAKADEVSEAIRRYGVDSSAGDPWTD